MKTHTEGDALKKKRNAKALEARYWRKTALRRQNSGGETLELRISHKGAK